MVRRFWKDESGQGMTEYILIIALVAVLVLGAVKIFGGKITTMFNTASDKIETGALKPMAESGNN